MIKGIFYLFSLLISIWALDSININGIFKKIDIINQEFYIF